MPAIALAGPPVFDLNTLLDKAASESPYVAVSRAQSAAAAAGIITAKSYLNPDIEMMTGPARYRNAPGGTNHNIGLTVTQPLEFSSTREKRRLLAEQELSVAEQGIQTTRFELRNQIKQAYLDVLLRQQVVKMMQANYDLLLQVRNKVKRKVEIGEAPKYELIKAETELLTAERDLGSAQTRIEESKAILNGVVGNLPEAFEIDERLPTLSALPDLASLRTQAENNPYLLQLMRAKQSAEAKLQLEQALRFPGVSVKSDFVQDPDVNTLRVGVVVPLPLWNKREGQIAQAVAGIDQADAVIRVQQQTLKREIDSAYQRSIIASNQVKAFENGLLQQSEATLSRAEAAYKFGERGILEYLDAQRVNRDVRRDYLIARFDYVFSLLQIERFIGADLIQP